MKKQCEDLTDFILKKWPKAKLYVQNGSAYHENEKTITHVNQWFVTLSPVSGMLSVAIYMVIRTMKALPVIERISAWQNAKRWQVCHQAPGA